MVTKTFTFLYIYVFDFSCVSLSGQLFDDFVTVVNFKQTEGPFMHSPTLWEHLEFHLTPPPCTFNPPTQPKRRLLSRDHTAPAQFSTVCSSPVTTEAKHSNLYTQADQRLTASHCDFNLYICLVIVLIFYFLQGKDGPAGLPGKAVSFSTRW